MARSQSQTFFRSSYLSILPVLSQATRLHAFIINCGSKHVVVVDLIGWKEEVVSFYKGSLTTIFHVAADHLRPRLTGFQNWFRLMWNVRALFRLHAGTFLAHCCHRSNRFCKLCCKWLKRWWLLRKRQCIRDRKRIGWRQTSVPFLSFLSCRERPLLAGKGRRRQGENLVSAWWDRNFIKFRCTNWI